MKSPFLWRRSLWGFVCFAVMSLYPGAGLRGENPATSPIWSHDNLYAWCVVAYDTKARGPEERAQMLQDLGFKQFVYDWRDKDVPNFDAEIEALQKHGITLLGWWCPPTAKDPKTQLILDALKRHNIHPQLWVRGAGTPTTTTEEQQQRVIQEADRINALVKLAAPYGCKIELYNHNGWFGQEENQLAVIDRLKELGVTDVGMVYNFAMAHDNLHDDTTHFPEIWKKIQGHVVAVNITGIVDNPLFAPTGPSHKMFYPSQGNHELEMMRTIQNSGWTGPIGLIAEKNGMSDPAEMLKAYLTGFDWLVAELKTPGSGGPRPFPAAK